MSFLTFLCELSSRAGGQIFEKESARVREREREREKEREREGLPVVVFLDHLIHEGVFPREVTVVRVCVHTCLHEPGPVCEVWADGRGHGPGLSRHGAQRPRVHT